MVAGKKSVGTKKTGKRKPRRKRCLNEGCKKFAPYGFAFCEDCTAAIDGPSVFE